MRETHQVFNQVPPLVDYNLFACDPALHDALAREGGGARATALDALGAQLGGAGILALGDQANRHPPVLATHDACGRRVDRVDFDPAWHHLSALLYASGVHSAAWLDPQPGAHVARAAAFYLHGQVEAGSLCPVTMTFAALPLLRAEPALWRTLAGRFAARDYDARDLPLAARRTLTVGMGLTEKQGGSDLRATTTTARALGAGGRGAEYALVGHKWFYSAPAADAHLVLARSADDALSCFFVPRWRPDGTRNAIRIERLKDKLGNRANASGEVEFDDAFGVLVDEPGRGLPALLTMAARTRLDCVLGSAALMRRALTEALHHARHRRAFGRPLLEHALMRNVLADLALESEATLALALHLAAAVDAGGEGEPGEGEAAASPAGESTGGDAAALARARRRILTPAAKFWVCKRAIAFTAECMEICGGNGYIEDGPMPRLLREAPVNSIWEGAGNVMCLDVLRALDREPEAATRLFDDLADSCAGEPRLVRALHALLPALSTSAAQQWQARALAAGLVLLTQAVLLRRHAPAAVADSFITSRFADTAAGTGDPLFGLLADPAAAPILLARAWQA
ncbi:acyl-CoA dehydrogenase family protein [Thauera aromatica]|uniref:acyl-CoA dehydrogenase family protein n=1 Tax=Thauera aromatica TaxID=59405 RepID=UPI001FFCDAF6|nr:acyl-CoA dehydrogenase family protein [Thauera aromatica]MCK2088935.1 acyl-CoA dehydrogenase family protein [Thauera aromatica]